MCSSPLERIAEIGQAIEDLASDVSLSHRADNAKTGGADDMAGQVVARLADLWSQIAEIDPDVATKIARYRD